MMSLESEAKDSNLDKNIQIKRKHSGDDPNKNAKILCKESRKQESNEKYEDSDYYFENYLRKVYPYYFTFTTFCKGRWVGKPLIEVFSQEFNAHSRQEYEKSILNGNIKINGNNIKADYILKENDCISNKVHRHEIAVLAAGMKIIHLSEEFVVIDKPPSLPVHPCGRYRYNTVLFILAKEYNLKNLHTVHRLDRLTSGLLLFTRTIKKSQEIDEQIRNRKVQKEYICRAEGNFPDGVISCKEPIEILSPKMGISIVSPSGRQCETEFEKMSYNGKSSVIKCRPFTGRMHQIRVHLQYLGYPIINDPIYNHATVFGPEKGKNGVTGKSRDQLLEDLMNTHNLGKWLLSDNVKEKDNDNNNHKDLENSEESYENKVTLNALKYYIDSEETKKLIANNIIKPEKITFEPNCDLCHQKYMDPEPKDMILFLHAFKYKGEDWEFETDLPAWTREDWQEM